MQYIYWFKQQAVALTYLAICGLIGYIFTLKSGWATKEVVLTADWAVMMLWNSFIFIFVVPFFFKWWDPANK